MIDASGQVGILDLAGTLGLTSSDVDDLAGFLVERWKCGWSVYPAGHRWFISLEAADEISFIVRRQPEILHQVIG